MTFGTMRHNYIIPVMRDSPFHLNSAWPRCVLSSTYGTLDDGYDRWGCQGQGHKPGEGTTGTDGNRCVLLAAGDTLFLTPLPEMKALQNISSRR